MLIDTPDLKVRDCTTLQEMYEELERQTLHNPLVQMVYQYAQNNPYMSNSDKFLMLAYHLLRESVVLRQALLNYMNVTPGPILVSSNDLKPGLTSNDDDDQDTNPE